MPSPQDLTHVSPSTILLTLFLSIPAYKICSVLLDPLHDIPGPWLARWTRLWYLYHIYLGDFEKTNVQLHKRYGKLVRIAPGEYSVDDLEAAKTIYGGGFVKVCMRCIFSHSIFSR